MAAKSGKTVVLGQPSWHLQTDAVELYVTETGGHVAPVTFDRQGGKYQPFAIAPWAGQKIGPENPPIIQVLRGDFFCMPFGGNDKAYRGEKHPIHGQTANGKWKLVGTETGDAGAFLHLRMKTTLRPGTVDKRLWLKQGQNAIYCQDVMSGMSGKMNFGHHANIMFPDEPGSGLLATSKRIYAQVFVEPTEVPANGGYSFLKAGAEITDLTAVETITGAKADLTRYPARRGWEDIAILCNDPQDEFAWAAVTFPKQRYVWFSLKDPRVLPATLLWMSNGGRHYAPWSSRHINIMGVEDIIGYFHYGIALSAAKNPLNERGIPTCHQLSPQQPLVVNYIMGVAKIPAGFDHVASICPTKGSKLELTSVSGKVATAAVDVAFLMATSGNG